MNNLSKIQKRIIIIVIVLIIGVVGFYIYGRESEPEVQEEEKIMIKPEEEQEEKEGKIMIHITGAVKNEGVYTLNENSRVTDAVTSAGGLTEDADMSKINLAYIIEDGMKIRIPSINDIDQDDSTNDEEIVETIPESRTNSGEASIVNINKATQTELETLPGIGPSTALKIINYREENGKFSSVDDLKNVNGIGESKFENIKDYVSVK